MDSFPRAREVEKPKTSRKVATIEVWENRTGILTPRGTYRAQFIGTDYVGYGDTITHAIAHMFEQMLAVAVTTAMAVAGKDD